MKTIVSALAGASLLCLALPAAAQSHRDGGAHDTWSRGGSFGGAASGAARGPTPGAPAPAAGGHWGGPGGAPTGSGHWGGSGSVPHGGFAGGHPFNGDRFHHRFHSFPVFVSGFGLGLGFAAFDPWFYGPYYGFYEPYPYYAWGYAPYPEPPPPSYYTPPRSAAPPSAEDAPSSPAACGSWVWDSAKQVYNWAPCAT